MRIPLLFRAPGLFGPARCPKNVSLIDLLPTVVELADDERGRESITTRYDGFSLLPLLRNEAGDRPDTVFAEMSGEGLQSPSIMIVEGPYKYVHCEGDPALLFDRSTDPHETRNLAGQPGFADLQTRLAMIIEDNWNLPEFRRQVLQSQRRRHLVDRAHAMGRAPSWDYDVPSSGSSEYFRPSAANPSASNYNDEFDVRVRADGTRANERKFP